ncbi:MAG: hypothetical protein AW08_02302 [Candidatus Accumulibacter adjunctus]|uniref:Uncharacterized protein n=1 Tax=Candidatus Accumulibacter adjunctus TaxID=1454001 RepID=A0A011MBT8_9PROT|nr:MAG: hypothetical protein AW08_02302 [Candidatus Accumulibacter adjunctus]
MMSAFPCWPEIFPPTRSFAGTQAAPAWSVDQQFLAGRPARVRDLFVDLAEVAAALRRRDVDADAIEIDADVLRIGAAVGFSAQAVRIHVRRIEVGSGGLLQVDPAADGGDCVLEIVCDELLLDDSAAPWISFLGFAPQLPPDEMSRRVHLKCARDATGDALITLEATDEVPPGDRLLGELQLLTAMRLCSCGAGAAAQIAELPACMASWVNRSQTHVAGDVRLALESALLLARLRSLRPQLHVVPSLRLERYSHLAEKTANALRAIDEECTHLFDAVADIGLRNGDAEVVLGHYRNCAALSQSLLQEARKDEAAAAAACAASRRKLEAQKGKLEQARKTFQDGCDEKTRQLKLEAGVGIGAAVLAVVVGVVATLFGSASGPTAAAQGVQGAATAAQQLSRLLQILNRIWDLVKAVRATLELMMTAQKVYEAVAKNIAGRQAVTQASSLASWSDPASGLEPVSVADWQALRVEVRAAFDDALKMDIGGASELLAAIEVFLILSEEAVNTGVHQARCMQVRLQREWEQQRDTSDAAAVEARRKALGQRAEIDRATLMFHERIQDQLKLQLVRAIGNMRDAYRYCTLREPGFAPSLTDSGATLYALLANAEEELTRFLEGAQRTSTWTPAAYRIWERHALDELRTERTLSWTISLNNYPRVERIRISEVHVWLVCSKPYHRNITILVSTPGIYRDRTSAGPIEFAAAPFSSTFQYNLLPPRAHAEARDHQGRSVHITLHGDDADKSRFEPTPFTTWRIHIPADLNRDLDLADIEEIGLEFRGTAAGIDASDASAGTTP